MSCNLSDLTSDPDFGTWPNVSASLAMMGMTMSIDLNIQTMEPTIGIGDYSTPGVVVFMDNYYQVSQNTLPVCAGNNWDPDSDLIYISYHDTEADFPLIARVKVSNGAWVEALPVDPLQPDNTLYYAHIPTEITSPVFTYNFSDNGIDFVSGSWAPVSLEDENQIATPLSCQMPNPFSSGQTIKIFSLDNTECHVQLFNLRGQKVGDLYNGRASSGTLSFVWDGRINGTKLPSGIYFMKIENSGKLKTHKFVITK